MRGSSRHSTDSTSATPLTDEFAGALLSAKSSRKGVADSNLPVSVLVVGSGVVGLSCALCLLQSGVSGVGAIRIIDQQPSSRLSFHPRARGIHPRSMEIFRYIGGIRMQDAISEAGRMLENVGGIRSASSLAEYIAKAQADDATPCAIATVRKVAKLLVGLGLLGFMLYCIIIWLGKGVTTTLTAVGTFLGNEVQSYLPLQHGTAFVCAGLVIGLGRLARRVYMSVQLAGRFTFCTQDLLEPLLLEQLTDRDVRPEFETQLSAIKECDDGLLEATLFDMQTKRTSIVRTRYIVGCDGARSSVRRLQNISFDSLPAGAPSAQCQQLNLYFRCDLTKLMKGRGFSLLNVSLPPSATNGSKLALPFGRALFATINNRDRWVLHVAVPNGSTDGEFLEANYPEAQCITMIREAIGDASGLAGFEIPTIELLGRMPWRSQARLAKEYTSSKNSSGHPRVFLAGDAAHIVPPWGGFGATTGVADAHNLAWKLAAVLAGHASENLLETYEAERRPQAASVGTIATHFNDPVGLLPHSGLSLLRKLLGLVSRVWGLLGVGYGYSSSAVYQNTGASSQKAHVVGPGTSHLCGEPGTRLPHVPLSAPFPPELTAAALPAAGKEWKIDTEQTHVSGDRADQKEVEGTDAKESDEAARLRARADLASARSSLDLCRGSGSGLVLLAGPDAGTFIEAVQRATLDLNIPLRTYQAGKNVWFQRPSNLLHAFLSSDLLQQLNERKTPQPFWPAAFGTPRSGGLLIRPDGFIAAAYRESGAHLGASQNAIAASEWVSKAVRQLYSRK